MVARASDTEPSVDGRQRVGQQRVKFCGFIGLAEPLLKYRVAQMRNEFPKLTDMIVGASEWHDDTEQ
jgi:hypothetical protein